MKRILGKGFAFAVMSLATGTMYAQFKISGEIRPRMEYRNGYKKLPTTTSKNAAFVDQRTRLNFDYKKDRIQFKVVLQDVRVWGNQSQLNGNEDYGVSIHEAWGQAFLNKNFSVRFGRQELIYDDHRIFGNVGWAQQARSHDAVVFKYQKDKIKFDFGGAYNQAKAQLTGTNYTVLNSYKTMQYFWGNYKASKEFNLSLLALSVGQQVNFTNTLGDADYYDNYTLTAGTRMVYKKNKFGASLNAYYQFGSANVMPVKDVSGYDIGVDVFYQVSKVFKATLGYEMLSGNSQTDTTASALNTNRAFNPYFGTNHKFNGFMDYFYVGNHIGSVGLNDIYLKLDFKLKKFSTGVTTHAFIANNDVLNQNELATTGNIEAMDAYLGTEIDVFGAFKLVPGATVKLGYSHMIGTDTMVAIRGGSTAATSNWGYVMIIMKPVLFDSSEKKKQKIK